MRSTRALSIVATAALVFALAPRARAEDKDLEAKKKQVELAIWAAINGSGPAIDACTAAYVAEYPAAKGNARLEAKVAKDGTVVSAAVTTGLEGARNLRPCLEKVMKSWKLPPHGADEPQPLSLTVPVYKGAKFVLKKPGEKAEPAPAGQPQAEEAAYNLNPGAFTPAWNNGQSGN